MPDALTDELARLSELPVGRGARRALGRATACSSDPDGGPARLHLHGGTTEPGFESEILAAASEAQRTLARAVALQLAYDSDGWWIEAVSPVDLTLAGGIRVAVALARDPRSPLSVGEALLRIDPPALATFFHGALDDADLPVLTTGLPASPGAASGRVALTADEAVAAHARGESVILVRRETTPEDVLGMQSSRGILTAHGGLVSHAAVVARGWGIPGVVGAAELQFADGRVRIAGHELFPGDPISIDGSTGAVYSGSSDVTTAAAPDELAVVLEWADAIRAGRVAVRANVDTENDAAHAVRLGAEGVGLCRTEHMLLRADRLPLVRRLISSDDPEEEADALDALETAQQHDFEALFRSLGERPVTIRLLDPPLHEFLPELEPLAISEALGHLDDESRHELAAVRRLQEKNPMIGTRGVRLGVVKPGLYPMQVRAAARALATVRREGYRPGVEIMIPLVVDAAELRLARQWVEEATAEVDLDGARLRVGAMIETPRAALLASELAEVSDFFSFGTNDLTQLTYAFSRDDVEVRLLPRYLDEGLLAHNPFEQLDEAGVGRLLRFAVTEARDANPNVKIGICGEHAGDPRSARFLVGCGLDYVSCSPYRVPIARLAVARALVDLGIVAADAVVPNVDAHSGAEPTDHSQRYEDAHLEPDELEFRTLHALRIKGFTSVETLADLVGAGLEPVGEQLAEFAAGKLVRFIDGRGLWQLTPAGKERHSEALRSTPADRVAALRAQYALFRDLNVRLKEVCIAWQTRAGQPNDHCDAGHDAGCIAALERLHADAEPVLDGLAEGDSRLAGYKERLDDAVEHVRAGEHQRFTGVMCGSYHDVWMELHEDLVLVLDVDRIAEGSF